MSDSNQELDILGIDISKAKFDVALLKNNSKNKLKSKVFANTPEGFVQLARVAR
jgi:transposase